ITTAHAAPHDEIYPHPPHNTTRITPIQPALPSDDYEKPALALFTNLRFWLNFCDEITLSNRRVTPSLGESAALAPFRCVHCGLPRREASSKLGGSHPGRTRCCQSD